VRVSSSHVSKSSNAFTHLPGSTSFRENLMPQGFSTSFLPWSIINLIPKWSVSCDISGVMAHYWNVSLEAAGPLTNERSITDGHSQELHAGCVI
jgi:hypothetical protein